MRLRYSTSRWLVITGGISRNSLRVMPRLPRKPAVRLLTPRPWSWQSRWRPRIRSASVSRSTSRCFTSRSSRTRTRRATPRRLPSTREATPSPRLTRPAAARAPRSSPSCATTSCVGPTPAFEALDHQHMGCSRRSRADPGPRRTRACDPAARPRAVMETGGNRPSMVGHRSQRGGRGRHQAAGAGRRSSARLLPPSSPLPRTRMRWRHRLFTAAEAASPAPATLPRAPTASR
mmetsp:Transcript_5988/g.13263  ORF Transcript_5988/g.13263 Transcript_5988/m.13263 type:complete len:233 (-) Transcript_5988:50-748(-)